MTPQEQNKFLGIGHLVYGGYNAFLMLFISLFTFPFLLALMFAALAGGEGGGGAAAFAIMIFVTVIVAAFYLLLTIPAFVAGYALLKHKPWAKTAAYISAVLAALNFPMGTGLCVFTFLFLTGEQGKAIYSAQAKELNNALPPPAYGWSSNPNVARERERQYTPPAQPPDWRR